MPKPARRPMGHATDEEKRLGELLRVELSGWPGVDVRPFFGMYGAWRGKRIFAALPRTRKFAGDNNVLLKFARVTKKLSARLDTDERITPFVLGGQVKWHRFHYATEGDLPDLLQYLALASEDEARPRSAKKA